MADRLLLFLSSKASSVRTVFFLLIFLFNGFQTVFASTAADTSKAAINLGLQPHFGFIIPHSSTIRDIADSNPWGIEADFSFHFTSAQAWQYTRGYPRLGFSLSYFNFNNPEVLGNSYSLVLYAEPFLSAHKDFSLSFRLGAGIAYLDNVYDPETNPDNLFYSTSISFPLVANLMANYRLDRHFMLRGGLTYNHISNGGMRQPNKGINYPTVSVGVNYALRTANFPERQEAGGFEPENKRDYLVALIGSFQDRHDDQSEQLPVVGLTAYVSQRISRLSALTGGAEWIADFALRDRIRDENGNTDYQRGALLAGHELRIGSFRFSQQLGVYVYAPHKAADPVYQRYGLEYHTTHMLYFGINLKAHRHVADFMDARVGLRF